MSLERMLRVRSARHPSPVQSAQSGGNVGSVHEAAETVLEKAGSLQERICAGCGETDSNDTVLEKAGTLQERIGAGCGETDSIDKLSATSGSRAGAFNVFDLDDGMGIASDPAVPETCQALVKAESAMQGKRQAGLTVARGLSHELQNSRIHLGGLTHNSRISYVIKCTCTLCCCLCHHWLLCIFSTVVCCCCCCCRCDAGCMCRWEEQG